MAAAYGAHGLEKRVNGDAGKLKSWNSASNIQMIHAVALLAISQSPALMARSTRFAAPLILLGTVGFSGSIQLLILDETKTLPRKVLGPTTPLGGLLLMAGWFSLLL
ncbi:hypothetical protein BGZ74_009502 [Mortierella antarctica]|nr:hypothetical protein BGZ74_009502 [Mortierella antarctica]